MQGKRILVTAGPTIEPIDPVRFISNYSSGKQGYAIAATCVELGAEVTLVSGPVSIPAPPGVQLRRVKTARQMLEVCVESLPVDLAICAAAVSDWRPATTADQKMKKQQGQESLTLELVKNPDILAALATHAKRPAHVIGFAAETEHHLEHAKQKLARKQCDAIVVNDVSPEQAVFGSESNHLHLLIKGQNEVIDLGQGSKTFLAKKLLIAVEKHFI